MPNSYTELAVADNTHAKSPAASHMYSIDENEVKLNDETSKHLHSSVAKSLYVAKRGRPDTLTAVSFLTTRVKSLNMVDYKN